MAVPVNCNYEARSRNEETAQSSKESTRHGCESRKILPNENANCPPMPRVSCSKTCAQRPPVSSAGAIRSRFLNRLGIQRGVPSSPPTIKAISRHENSKDITEDPTSDTDTRSERSSSFSSYSSFGSSKARSVSFDDSVTVRPIPRHDEYSDDVRTKIWSDPLEIYENASRNSMEFAADNFDWKHAAEEDEFVPTVTGELVHPIHYVRQCNMQRNFLLVMKARQQHCR